MATVGYGIVIYAMSRGAMAHVSALRETSVVIAALIGTVVLGEPGSPPASPPPASSRPASS